MAVIFFLSAAALCLLAVALLVVVILRQPSNSRTDRLQKNVQIARQRLDDLKQREKSEELGSEEAALQQQEIERGLLDDITGADITEEPQSDSRASKVPQWTAVCVAISFPVTAAVLYLLLGEPSIIADPELASRQAVINQPQDSQASTGERPSFDQMIQTLQAHLEVDTEDAQGWATLAQIYVVEQRFGEAAVAYARVRAINGDSADVLVRQADALAMANNGNLQGEPSELIGKALTLDPQHGSGLWLAGLAAAARGDFQAALDHWTDAERNITNEESLLEIRRLITEARARLGVSGESEAIGVSPVDGGPSIQVSVEIQPDIVAEVQPDDVVFIFAQAAQGPPVPLAVIKKQVKDLPATFELDDSLAMVPNMKISAFNEVRVVARISRSGTAQQGSGDYFGQTGLIRTSDEQEVKLTISQQVP